MEIEMEQGTKQETVAECFCVAFLQEEFSL
jgi:hypothetical protein